MKEPRIVRQRAAHVVVHAIVRGHVHGVGFRAWVEYHAQQDGLEGWVRNRRDGTVEAVFAGQRPSVESMIASCRRGPPSARVDAVDTRDGTQADTAMARAGSFSVLPTV